MSPWTAAPLLAALSLALPGRAAAESCARPDVLHTFPVDRAVDVPTNATLSARYASSADYLGEDVVLTPDGQEARHYVADFNANEVTLSLTPRDGLPVDTTFSLSWPKLRGINTASLGTGATVTFTTGAGEDHEAPSFQGLTKIAWDVERKQDECTSALEDRFVFDLSMGSAEDNSGREALLLDVFQTRGPTIGAEDAPSSVYLGPLPAAGKPLRLRRSVKEAVGRVCFSAIVRDLAGATSSSGSVERCATTRRPPFFLGCSTAPRAPSGESRWLASCWLGIAALGVARRRRSAA